MLNGGCTGSSCSSTDYHHVVGDQVIWKHPAQRSMNKRYTTMIKVFLTQQGGTEIQYICGTEWFLKPFKPITNGRTTLSHAKSSKLQRHQVLGDEALSNLLSCFVDN